MYSKKDILARLQNGEPSEKIANEIADMLNSAIAQYEEETNKIKIQKQKEKDADKIAKSLNAYLGTYYSEIMGDEVTAFTGADLDKIINGGIQLAKEVDNFKKILSDKDVDQILADFLCEMKL